MAAPMVDLHLKHIIEYGFKVIRSNPDKHLKDIFGDAKLDAHAALYGGRMIEQVKNWFTKVNVPVILGFDVVEAQMPAVTVHLAGASPSSSFLGDHAGFTREAIYSHQREVIVPAFQPASAEFNGDKSNLKITLPEDMPFAQKELWLPGLIVRDQAGREYSISVDDDGNKLILQRHEHQPLSEIDLSKLEIVTPLMDVGYGRGMMVYDETATIAIHGHSNRNEGLWLYYIVMWTLLKFRPLMESTLGLALSFPAASDYQRDEAFGDSHIWRRYITLQTKTTWSWEGAQQQDILGLLSLGMAVFKS